jgi:hypothetical protein
MDWTWIGHGLDILVQALHNESSAKRRNIKHFLVTASYGDVIALRNIRNGRCIAIACAALRGEI